MDQGFVYTKVYSIMQNKKKQQLQTTCIDFASDSFALKQISEGLKQVLKSTLFFFLLGFLFYRQLQLLTTKLYMNEC